jgi:signal transduction histidine kinase
LQRHGAELEIQSTLGSGSEFICHFPLGRVQLARVTQAAEV